LSARNQSPRVSGDQRKKVGEDDSEEKFSKNGWLPESFADQSTEIDTEYEDREAEYKRRGFASSGGFTIDPGGN
jgi:hypothetical protein